MLKRDPAGRFGATPGPAPRIKIRQPRSAARCNNSGARSDPATRAGRALPSHCEAQTKGLPSQSTRSACAKISCSCPSCLPARENRRWA